MVNRKGHTQHGKRKALRMVQVKDIKKSKNARINKHHIKSGLLNRVVRYFYMDALAI